MADADEDAIRGPSTEASQIETDLSDETQDFRLLNHLNLYVHAFEQANGLKADYASTAYPTHPPLVSPAVVRKISSPTRPNTKPMYSPPRVRQCTMPSPIRAFTTPKIMLWEFTRPMAQCHQLMYRYRTVGALACTQIRASSCLLRRARFSSQWGRRIGGIGFGCYPRKRFIWWREVAWISGGRVLR